MSSSNIENPDAGLPDQEKEDSPLPESKEQRKKRRFFFFLFKSIGVILGIIILIPLSLFILSLNDDFRQWGIQKIVGVVNESLEGEIAVKDIDFFDKDGIRISDLVVKAAGDTLADIPDLLVDVNFRELLDQKVIVNSLSINDSQIKLIRDRDSIWNFTRIAKPSTSQDTTTSDAAWEIEVENINLNNSDFTFRDSTQQFDSLGNNLIQPKYDILNFSDFRLLSLDFAGNDIVVLPANQLYLADIQNLSFRDNKSGANLDKFTGEVSLTKSGIAIDNAYLEIDSTQVSFDAGLDEYDLFAGQEFNTALLSLNFEAESITGEEIGDFVRIPITLKKAANLSADLSGKLDSINIDKILIDLNKTSLELSGELLNTTNPETLHYDIHLDNSVVSRSDLSLLKGLELDAIPDFRRAELKRLRLQGGIYNAKGIIDITSPLGGIKGTVKSSWRNQITYAFDGLINNVDLAAIINNDALESDLTGALVAEGSGTDIKSLTAKIDYQGDYNRFTDYSFDQVQVVAKLQDGVARLDAFTLTKYDSGDDPFAVENEVISLLGAIDFNDLDNPSYELTIDAQALNVNKLLSNSLAPNYLTGQLELAGKGIDPNNIVGGLDANIDLIIFEDRALLPFDLFLDFENVNERKKISLESDFMNLYVEGDFYFEDLANTIQIHSTEFASYGTAQLNKIIQSTQRIDDGIVENDTTNLESFPKLEAKIFGEITDLSPVSIFIDSTNIYSTININMSLNNQDSISVFNIDSISIDELGLSQGDLRLTTKNLFLSGKLEMGLEANEPKFNSFRLNTDAREPVRLNGNTFSETYLYSRLENDTLGISSHVNFNEELNLSLIGNMYVKTNQLDMDLEVLEIGYDSLQTWKNTKDIRARFGETGFYIDSLMLQREDKEVITLTGAYDSQKDIFEDVNLTVTGFDFKYIDEIVPLSNTTYLEYTKGELDSLSISISGGMADPDIDLLFRTKGLFFNRVPIGDLSADFSHDNDIISGVIQTDRDSASADSYRINVNSIPFSLALEEKDTRWHKKAPIDIELDVDSLSLALFDPFLEFMDRSKGYINVDVDVNGSGPDDFSVDGQIMYENISTLIYPTNIFYRSTGDIDISKNQIEINKLEVSNLNSVLAGSLAEVKGVIDLEEFVPKKLDLKVNIDRLQILSDKSKETLPKIYGDLVIATGREGINISGNIESPRVAGDIEVLRSNLTLPLDEITESAEAKFNYHWEGENIYMYVLSDTLTENVEQEKRTAPMYEATGIDFRVYFPSDLVVNINVNQFMSIEAHIGTRLKGNHISFQKAPYSEEARLLGKIYLQEDSKLDFAGREFETTGNISFPTGEVDNPNLDITAVYDGRITSSDNVKDFSVSISIKGPKENPKITYDYTIGNNNGNTDKSEKTLEDVLSLVVLGVLPSGVGDSGGESNLGSNATSTLLNPALKSFINEVAGTLSFLDLEVSGGGNIENTSVRLRGKIVDGIYLSGGGGLYGQEITIEIPLAELFDDNSFENFKLQFTQFINNNRNATVKEQINSEFKFRWAKTW